jgi:hypothetical protein
MEDHRSPVSKTTPKLIVLGFVENAKNPFHFQNQKVKKLEISINGVIMETRPIEPNFTDEQYPRSYLSLYKGLGKLGQDWSPDITLEEYKNGYTLWCVDFTKDG